MGVLESIKAAAYGALGAAASFFLMLGIYEGLPLVRDIPYIGSIPIIGELATGRVATESAKAATAARAGYVELSEKTALQVQLAEERRSRLRASHLYDEAQKRTTAAAQANRIANEKLQKDINKDTGADGAVWGADDLDWLSNH